jgi:diamine N-acetyltransferase
MAMMIETKNHKQLLLRKMLAEDVDGLVYYFGHLSNDTKKRFSPHAFGKNAIMDLFSTPESYAGYIAIDMDTSAIAAYSIIKMGWLDHDRLRLQSYGLIPGNKTDCTFAPSVADAWQGCGVGNSLFNFILSDLKLMGCKRIILWGGVQTGNNNAVNFYKKNGFITLSYFEYNGLNADMILNIS